MELMRTLSDTISRLAALKASAASPKPNRGPSRLLPLGGTAPNPGKLEARIYIPSRPAARAALVVVLHGCTQTAEDYDDGAGWSTLAEEQGFFLLFPEQQRPNNPNLCFNWFMPEQTRRGRGEALSIRQMIEKMVTLHDIDAGRVYITGLSAGGAMAAAMLAVYPEIFAAGAIVAGLPYGVANGVPEAFDRMRGQGLPSPSSLQALLRNASTHRGPWPSISIWQGAADGTVHVANSDALADQWRAVHRLDPLPTATRTLAGRTTTEWCDSDGQMKVAHHLIAGMGHGTPIASVGPRAYGRAGPFMLDVGISSTYEIAQSWGLITRAEADGRAAREAGAVSGDEYVHSDAMPSRGDAAPSPNSATPGGVRDVIEAALKSAGLMR